MSSLDRQKIIDSLERQVTSLATSSEEQGVDLSREILRLKKKIAALRAQNLHALSAWDKVTLARLRGRPTTLDCIEHLFEDFLELHGDRATGDDRSVVGGIASFGGRPVTVIGQQKG